MRGIADHEEIANFIEAFTGSNRFVIDYLADEVLARQPPQVRDFLLRTAVLDRLHGPLCDAVTGGTDGTRTLEDLERENLFVVPLDAERFWYRYHHLFADVLHARLLAEHPAGLPDLHMRASDWFATSGMVADAVRHALAAEDFDAARIAGVPRGAVRTCGLRISRAVRRRGDPAGQRFAIRARLERLDERRRRARALRARDTKPVRSS